MSKRLQDLLTITDTIDTSVMLVKDNQTGVFQDQGILVTDFLQHLIPKVDAPLANPSIYQIMRLINNGSGHPAIPAVSGKFLTEMDTTISNATASVLGKTKLSDSITSSLNAASSHTAASPLAVKLVNDLKPNRASTETITGTWSFNHLTTHKAGINVTGDATVTSGISKVTNHGNSAVMGVSSTASLGAYIQNTNNGNTIYIADGNAPIFNQAGTHRKIYNEGFKPNSSDVGLPSLSMSGGNTLKIQTPTGYGVLGSQNTSHFHFMTDKPDFYFQRMISVDGDINLYNHQTTKFERTTGHIFELGQRVYSPNNKPSASALGVLPLTGGTVSGNFAAQIVTATAFHTSSWSIDNNTNSALRFRHANVEKGFLTSSGELHVNAVYDLGQRVYSPVNKMHWDDVQSKPNLAINGFASSFTSVTSPAYHFTGSASSNTLMSMNNAPVGSSTYINYVGGQNVAVFIRGAAQANNIADFYGQLRENGQRVFSPNHLPTWTQVTGKPNVAINNASATFTGINLNGANALITGHCNTGQANYLLFKKNNASNWYVGAGTGSNDNVNLHSFVYNKGLLVGSTGLTEYSGNTHGKVYSEIHKPTWNEVQSKPSVVIQHGAAAITTLTSVNNSTTVADIISFPTSASSGKHFLRKFRGGHNDTVWWETVQQGEYRLATGVTDSAEMFKIDSAHGYLHGHKIYDEGNKPTPAAIGAIPVNGHAGSANTSEALGSTNLNKLTTAYTVIPNAAWYQTAKTGHVQMVQPSSHGLPVVDSGYVIKIGARDTGQGSSWLFVSDYAGAHSRLFFGSTDANNAVPNWVEAFSANHKPTHADIAGNYDFGTF